MMRTINENVITPVGAGVTSGRYFDGRVIVRVPVTPENRASLGQALTPRATRSGLWAFDERDLRVGGGKRK